MLISISCSNVFDFSIVVLGVASQIFYNGYVGSLFRASHALRVARVVEFVPILQRLVKSLVLALPGSLNVMVTVGEFYYSNVSWFNLVYKLACFIFSQL